MSANFKPKMPSEDQELLARTLAVASKDVRTTTDEGSFIQPLPEGSILRPSVPIVDERGSLFEIFSSQWQLDSGSFEQVYAATMRPGIVKGWALHKKHDDRYFIISGELQVVLYDVRPESSTCGELFKVTLSEKNRRLLTIPAFVWHADFNPGHTEVIMLNMPSQPFNPADPDKYRLPIDTDLIPHDFGDARGW